VDVICKWWRIIQS